MKNFRILFSFLLLAFGASVTLAADDLPVEDDYYSIHKLAIPKGIVLETGAFELLPDGRLATCTRRGEIYLIENAFSKSDSAKSDSAKSAKSVTFKRFAHGLHETLGLAYKDGWFYVTQRGEMSRLKDVDGDDRADIFETFSTGWEITGDYHEYAFGSKFDRDGNLWVSLCLTGSFTSQCKYRGWALRITPEGKTIPTVGGIRSPGGMGMNAAGDMFFTENQGPWNGTCALKHLKPKSFQGHPAGNRWYDLAKKTMGPRPNDPKSGSRILTEAAKIPQLEPPAVMFPYLKMGQSASGIVCDTTDGRFGPFKNQMFVGDQRHSTVMRVYLEKVNGHYQGACFPFRKGFGSGNLAMLMTADGSMFVGGTNRGWGSQGRKPFALERLNWTGKVPFEIHEMRARSDGFELTFTKPVDPQAAAKVDSYKLTTYTYIYQASYGSPEVDHTTPKITRIDVSDDRKSVRMYVDGLQPGHVHELHAEGVRSTTDQPLLHKEAYYTLNYIPSPVVISTAPVAVTID